MGQRWYVSRDGRSRRGPYSSRALCDLALAGQIHPDDMILREGGRRWRRAAELKGLFAADPAAAFEPEPEPLPAPAPPPTPVPAPAPRRLREPRPGRPLALIEALTSLAVLGVVVYFPFGKLAELNNGPLPPAMVRNTGTEKPPGLAPGPSVVAEVDGLRVGVLLVCRSPTVPVVSFVVLRVENTSATRLIRSFDPTRLSGATADVKATDEHGNDYTVSAEARKQAVGAGFLKESAAELPPGEWVVCTLAVRTPLPVAHTLLLDLPPLLGSGKNRLALEVPLKRGTARLYPPVNALFPVADPDRVIDPVELEADYLAGDCGRHSDDWNRRLGYTRKPTYTLPNRRVPPEVLEKRTGHDALSLRIEEQVLSETDARKLLEGRSEAEVRQAFGPPSRTDPGNILVYETTHFHQPNPKLEKATQLLLTLDDGKVAIVRLLVVVRPIPTLTP